MPYRAAYDIQVRSWLTDQLTAALKDHMVYSVRFGIVSALDPTNSIGPTGLFLYPLLLCIYEAYVPLDSIETTQSVLDQVPVLLTCGRSDNCGSMTNSSSEVVEF